MLSTIDATERLSKGLELAWSPSVSGPSGYRAFDFSGRQRHGTLASMIDPGTAWITRENGTVLAVDGVDDRVSFPSSGLQLTGPITISYWLVIRNTGTFATIISKGDSTTNEFELAADFRSGATILAWRPGSSTSFNSFFDGFVNRWVHVAVTCNSAASNATIAAFRNGSFFGSITGNTARTATSNSVTVGMRPGITNPGQFQIDDFRLYSRVLNPQEIQLLASARGVGLRLWERSRRRSRLAISSGVDLTANGITTGAPVLGTPALTQNHVVTATPPSVAAPTLGTPALSQNHVVTITPPSVGAPVLGTPSLTQNHAITATPPSIAAPTLGTPSLSQNHTLTATPPSIGAPVLGTPSLAGAGELLPNGITTGSPTLGTPSLTQNHVVGITPPSVGAPVLGTPGLSQNHVVVVVPPSIAAPTLGIPTLSSGGSVSLTPRAPIIGSPVLGRPVLTITESAELSSSDYAFLLLLDREGRDVSYINPDGSTSTFKAVVHKQKHVQRQDDYGIEEQMHRDVSFLATNARGRASVLQYAEMRIDGIRYQVERYVRNAGRWRCTLKRVEVNEVARPNRRGRQ